MGAGLDTRWRNLLVVALLLVVLFSLWQAYVLFFGSARFFELTFSQSQLSSLDASVGSTPEQKMEVIRNGFRIIDKESLQAVAQPVDMRVRSHTDGSFSLLIPNLRPAKDYQYAIDLNDYDTVVSEISDVQSGEFVDG
ncbi:MAG: hypothetical protein Q7R47_03065 [Candidatus Diapherotrites archaeon]|nr:hypothetical protein [Candidatus Diapherotrites archaeon]